MIIFLDFDGVIRIPILDPKSGQIEFNFCQLIIHRLANFCSSNKAQLVVSSDWRSHDNRDEIAGLIGQELAAHLHPDWGTPITGIRHEEILQWLFNHPEVSNYRIVDDVEAHFDGASEKMISRLELCVSNQGLTSEILERLASSPQDP